MNNRYEINEETLQDIINIETGLLYPLTGFMTYKDFISVVKDYTLKDGQIFTIPITLDVPEDLYNKIETGEKLSLTYMNKEAAEIIVEDKFEVSIKDIEKVFGTNEDKHPGVKKELERSSFRIGGQTILTDKSYLKNALKPENTREIFRKKGWKTIVGFQTRNPVHKAHEHLQRIGLEICDGLFINPIVGWKKKGDFTEEAVLAAYHKMRDKFYPENRVYIDGLKTQMRYAGPREAVFHAIIRRNLGCTHFIIGRDHAGVGGYYGAYDAHKLARKLSEKHELGINLLLLHEPYYCKKCGQVVSEKNCSHYNTDRIEISGTIIRSYISQGTIPNEIMLRKEIFEAIMGCDKIFIED